MKVTKLKSTEVAQMMRNRVTAESYTNSQIPKKEGIAMTSRKFSRKRSGQVLGLVALSLVLLVGWSEYGTADYGRIGRQQVLTAVQEEESPATFTVEATVNRNGGLQVQLPDPPDGPGVFLEVQFVVDGSREPHQLVPRGTIVSIVGVAKEGVTKWSGALAELETLLFFATVGAGQDRRQLFAEVNSSAWSGGLALSGMTTGDIFLQKVLLLAFPGFTCCESSILLRKVTMEITFNQNVPEPGAPAEGNRVLEVVYTVPVTLTCMPGQPPPAKCRGTFAATVAARLRSSAPDPAGAANPLSEEINVSWFERDCKAAAYDGRIIIRYRAKFPGPSPLMGALSIDITDIGGKALGLNHTLPSPPSLPKDLEPPGKKPKYKIEPQPKKKP
jgi:hypothetical protein